MRTWASACSTKISSDHCNLLELNINKELESDKGFLCGVAFYFYMEGV